MAAFRDDLLHWIRYQPRLAVRVMELVEAVMREPFTGIGKPEPLRGAFAGAWSRRVDQEQRLIYMVEDTKVIFLACRGHYTS